mmetsp:Transcript_45651/g.138714  ORF Transcript_45651/g.138714 Transcript_45651/m.138714 type:complete len:218 (-) Transcript_45651:13-666(-)
MEARPLAMPLTAGAGDVGFAGAVLLGFAGVPPPLPVLVASSLSTPPIPSAAAAPIDSGRVNAALAPLHAAVTPSLIFISSLSSFSSHRASNRSTDDDTDVRTSARLVWKARRDWPTDPRERREDPPPPPEGGVDGMTAMVEPPPFPPPPSPPPSPFSPPAESTAEAPAAPSAFIFPGTGSSPPASSSSSAFGRKSSSEGSSAAALGIVSWSRHKFEG